MISDGSTQYLTMGPISVVTGAPWGSIWKILMCRTLVFLLEEGRRMGLEKEMATHSSILAWRRRRTKEPGGLQRVGSQRARHDGSDLARRHVHVHARRWGGGWRVHR